MANETNPDTKRVCGAGVEGNSMSESEFEICPDCRGLCGKANADVTI